MNKSPNCELNILQLIKPEAPLRLKVILSSRDTVTSFSDDREKDSLRNFERLLRIDVDNRPRAYHSSACWKQNRTAEGRGS
jgi:hypothetical protein